MEYMEDEILIKLENIKKERIETISSIKCIQEIIENISIKYITNSSKLNFTDEQKNNIINTIKFYDNILDKKIEKDIISYFRKIYNNHKFEFFKKTKGIQIGKIVKITNLTNDKSITYYVKTHQNGSNLKKYNENILDIKEIYIYKLLYNLDIGPEIHWFKSLEFKKTIYIATRELDNNCLDIEDEIIKIDIITRILMLNDVMCNKSNVLQDKNKGYIIDFRIQKIVNVKNPYLYDEIYNSFLSYKNDNYHENFNRYILHQNNKNKIKILKLVINKLNNFNDIVKNTYKEIQDDIVIKEYNNIDLLIYIENIKSNYKNLNI